MKKYTDSFQFFIDADAKATKGVTEMKAANDKFWTDYAAQVKAAIDPMYDFYEEAEKLYKLSRVSPLLGGLSPQQYNAALGAAWAKSPEGARDEELNRQADAVRAAIDPWSAYAAELDKVNEVYTEGKITIDEFDERVQQLWDTLAPAGIEAMQRLSLEMGRFHQNMSQLGRALGRSLEDMIFNFKSWGDTLKSLLKDLAHAIITANIINPLIDAISGGISSQKGKGGFGGALARVFGGGFMDPGLFTGRAGGGPVLPGRAYVVGEGGPEIFLPSSAGAIVPGGGQGGAGVVYNIDARWAGPGVEHAISRALQLVEQRATLRAVNATQERALRTA